jgi:acyl-CoA synthetase (AMP-forming)/AMP-acid ligase II
LSTTRDPLLPSLIGRAGDSFTVDHTRVRPAEIEDACLREPRRLISDVVVAGVQGPLHQKVPRAWIILNVVMMQLEKWTKETLSPPQWLAGGIEVVNEVGFTGLKKNSR